MTSISPDANPGNGKVRPRVTGTAKLLLGGFVRVVVDIGKRWFRHDHSRSAAALAFYSLFSLVPLLLISLKIAGGLVGVEAARAEIGLASGMFFDQGSADYLLGLVENHGIPEGSGWASLVGFAVLIFTASKVVVELREVLSVIFGAPPPRKGRRGWLVTQFLKRGVPVLLILSLGFLIALSALLGALFHLFTERYSGGSPDLMIWKRFGQIGPLVLLALSFVFVLRWLPPSPPCFRAAAVGATIACLLLAALRNLMISYFENAGVTSLYGAAVTLVAVLLWIYFSVQIFFIGAETASYFQRKWIGSREPESFGERAVARGDMLGSESAEGGAEGDE